MAAVKPDWEDRYIAARDELACEMLVDCATEVPEILPDVVCAVDEVPDEDRVTDWAQNIVADNIDEVQDLLWQADQVIKRRIKEAEKSKE